MSKPAGWTPADEAEYQAWLNNTRARLEAAGSSDDVSVMLGAYMMLVNPIDGRDEFLKAKANGWL